MMRRLLLLFIIPAVIICSISVSSADRGSSNQTIRIAAFNFYPAIFQAKDGSVQGFYVDFLKEIAKREGWHIEYVYGSWTNGLARIKTGEVEVLTNVAFTNERATFMDYGKEPILTVWSELYARIGSKMDSIRDVEAKKIAVMKGDYNAANFRHLIEKFEIHCKIVEYSNFEEVFEAIASLQVDGGVVNNTFGTAKQKEYDVKSTGVIFSPFDIYFTVAKGKNHSILKTLDNYLVEWRKTETSPYHQARERWSHKSVSTMEVIPQWTKNALYILLIASGLFMAFIVLLRLQIRRKTAEIVHQTENRRMIEELLQFLNDNGARLRGEELIFSITSYVATRLKVEYVFVGKLLPENRIKTLGLNANGTSGHEREYDLHGTPCENVVGKNLCLYPDKVTSQFPEDKLLEEMGAEGYAATPLQDSQGEPIGVLGIICKSPLENGQLIESIIQIAASRVTQELESMRRLDEVQEYSHRLELATQATQAGIWDWNLKDNTMLWDDRMLELYGFTRETFVGGGVEAWRNGLHPEDRDSIWEECQAALRGEKEWNAEFRILLPNGTIRYIKTNGLVVRGSDDVAIRMLGTNRDITERKQAEIDRSRQKALFEAIFTCIPDAIVYTNIDREVIAVNPAFSSIFGFTIHDLTGMKTSYFYESEEEYERQGRIRFNLTATEQTLPYEVSYRRKDGMTFRGETLGTVVRSADGTAMGFIGVIRDISERKKAEEEKVKMESQLHQAQKLESIGSLAGGVAHDFNNKLSVILGYTQLSQMKADPESELYSHLQEISRAATQSADLTRQLLAFARKQTIAPKVLDLNETITGMLKMLNRLIGENINLDWQPASDLWPINFDPSQIDQILANLCVNAKDSITENGKITIETGNCTIDESYTTGHTDTVAGDYVKLVVSDNGSGMDKETVGRIFEPFFTTKETGKGTGLGLATVFGIVRQNNGFINVYSEPGIGTTFTINLPRHRGKILPTQTEGIMLPTPRGQETILLVEDELAILNMATMILTRQGYAVLSANSPTEALRLGKENAGKIHLLITDVIMPDTNGKDLAHALQSQNPGLKNIYMSGYTADAISRHGVLEEGVNFIQKPFSLIDFANKVRDVLDSK